jgi:adenine-specific DNA-methyltransferase
VDFNSPFLTRQIIAYIGNKRRLLDLIYKAIRSSVKEIKPGLKFFDVFAGSGIVSRLGKELNFELFTNDWEKYSYVLNNGFLKTDKRDIPRIFGSEKEFKALLEYLNNLPQPQESDCYISKYYAPESFDINRVDFRKERLFYTRENALTIDKIRNYIEREYGGEEHFEARNILLSLLIYEAATHTNTSGVFKAYHKGFGGHGHDAMKRILSPIVMSEPILIDSDFPVHVYQEDANELVKQMKDIDIAYLDPPYNQHQYGSNYHMLNTIALWDKIPAPLDLDERGVLKEKAAIRKDWTKTKSTYCYQDSAISSFTDLIENLDSRHILISYSTDGIIPFDLMKEICTKKGKISIVTNEYTKYRGGKQSNNRLNTNIEFILTIDTEKKSTKYSMDKIESIINKKRILLMFKQKYSYVRLLGYCLLIDGEDIVFNTGKRDLLIPSNSHFELFPVEEINDLTAKETNVLYDILSHCVCLTKEEELEEIISKINGNKEKDIYFIKLIPHTLKKLAHKKNKKRFYYWLEKIKQIEKTHKGLYSHIKEEISSIEELAEKRFNN